MKALERPTVLAEQIPLMLHQAIYGESCAGIIQSSPASRTVFAAA
jgi:hypothetical protein